jgi:hypothetical protein
MQSPAAAEEAARSADLVDLSAPTRQLLRFLRSQPERVDQSVGGRLPESLLWLTFLELRRRGEPEATTLFLRSLRALLQRRSIGLPMANPGAPDPDEHKLTDDPMLAELWKAFVRCIASGRTGPAGQLLRDIEAQITQH